MGSGGKTSRLQQLREEAEALIEERGLESEAKWSRLRRFSHFWVLVWKSFVRNRCPVRASALAYTTLLALIPMLAVVMGITSTFLKDVGEKTIDDFIVKMVASLTPPAMLSTNIVVASTNVVVETIPADPESPTATTPSDGTNTVAAKTVTQAQEVVVPAFVQDESMVAARQEASRRIRMFIQNTRSGALGVTGTVLLIFTAIMMLSRIEVTFNEIWGVARGRTWFMRVILYWGVISLAPLLLVVAAGLATGPHLNSTKELLTTMPLIGNLAFRLLPIVLLCLTFGAFYKLMPNTKVSWQAGLAGGVTAGLLFHLNNLANVLFVSRVVSNSKIYGGFALVPVFMIGLYVAWLIVLLGGQVAYAYQNRSTYLEEKQADNINQRGREFVAFRLMTYLGQRFFAGEPPPTAYVMSAELGVPTRLIGQVMRTLATARLVIETSGTETGYMPARPLESITCDDILQAMRASQGHELETRDGPVRAEVYGEFNRIREAERAAAASVNMLGLVNRADAQVRRLALGSVPVTPKGNGSAAAGSPS
jgi:membrane protein